MTVRSPTGVTGDAPQTRAEMLQHRLFQDIRVRVFAKQSSTTWVDLLASTFHARSLRSSAQRSHSHCQNHRADSNAAALRLRRPSRRRSHDASARIDAAAIIVSNVIGGGILFTPPQVAASVPNPWLFLATWVAGGVLAFAGAMAYAELAALRPRAGGEYVYLRAAFGRLAAFLTGWTSFVAGFSGAIAASAVVLAFYVGRFVPGRERRDAAPRHPAAVRAADGLAAVDRRARRDLR